ncbi:MAG TPA: polysaccharide deacetylase family protein [Kofleriaceae bacterium]|jgi:peptidoglycan/xylan/chitin deacetylase (PgdA/CDA1 family)
MRFFVVLALALAVGPAEASKPKKHYKAWPLPAAGPTASGDPELIFTFDDGPNPKTTPAVLDALAKHHIHAIFFMVGEMAANKSAQPIIQRIVREGHIIGNHTMTHQDLCRLKDDERASREIDEAKQVIEKASGLELAWFRTPYGVRCDRVEAMLDERHLGHFHWDLDPQEWKHGSAKKAIDYVEKHVGEMTGRNVLLMHDIKKATVEALPEILDWIDAENARRKDAHKRRIRIIQSYELAEQRLPDGLLDWLGDAADPHRWTSAVASVLP